MIKGIIFDLDGTLLDRDKSMVAFLEDQYNRIQALQSVEKHIFMECFQYHCIGFAGLFEILDFLKGMKVKLGIITNGFGKFQMNNIRGLKIDHYFDEVLISEIEGISKPNIEIFQRSMERLGLQPEETMFIGDHPINDVDASVDAGMIGIWKEDNYFEKPSRNHIPIKYLIEIKGLIIQKSRD